MIEKGTWWIESEENPDWDMSGKAFVGCFVMPKEAKDAIEKKKKELKQTPPNDLRWGYMKD